MTVNELKSQLARYNIRPDKRLGQNFLLNEEVLDKIVEAADLSKADTILEIGPGLGFLTARLGQRAGKVIAIEKDRKLARVLNKIFKKNKNIKIINDDVLYLTADSSQLTAGYKVVANIPYYLTGKIIQNFLTARYKPNLMVLLLQKEVAKRITALPGQMSILSVSVQLYADPEIISHVGKENFYPVPEVDSATVRLKILSKPRLAVDEKEFFRLVKIGFSNKRKQLQNNLAAGLGKTVDYKELLVDLQLNPLTRAQDLSLVEWGRLYDKLKFQSSNVKSNPKS